MIDEWIKGYYLLPLAFFIKMKMLSKLKNWYKLFHPGFQKLILDYPVDMVPRYGHGKEPHKILYEIINSKRQDYKDILSTIGQFRDVFHSIKTAGKESDSTRPVWNNGFLPGLDIVALFAMVATYKPQRYLEIGSGNSTKVAALAKKMFSPDTEIVSIDPAPRAEIDHVADEIMRKPFEYVNIADLPTLNSGDILFIDNSHRVLPNSDATVFFLELLPSLPKGVIVQIHDVYLPYDYPQFMCNRFYSEQYALACYLLANSKKFSPILPNYFISQDQELSNIIAPLWDNSHLTDVEQHGGSFWIRINE